MERLRLRVKSPAQEPNHDCTDKQLEALTSEPSLCHGCDHTRPLISNCPRGNVSPLTLPKKKN